MTRVLAAGATLLLVHCTKGGDTVDRTTSLVEHSGPILADPIDRRLERPSGSDQHGLAWNATCDDPNVALLLRVASESFARCLSREGATASSLRIDFDVGGEGIAMALSVQGIEGLSAGTHQCIELRARAIRFSPQVPPCHVSLAAQGT
jgi:hypothetical protein